ncbi:MAG TPA: sugar ABC transporter permease [Tepidisphaeraceae bacterium]|nr:sugar ABC transporter permease [Tepidisphaeraceae bacterium]
MVVDVQRPQAAPRTQPPPAAHRVRRRSSEGTPLPWVLLFLGPMALGLLVFYIGPVLVTFYYSFTEWGVFGGVTWVGLANYAQVFTSPEVGRALLNTVIYTAIVLLSIPVALLIATLLSRRSLRFVSVYRLLFFLPVITMPVAIGWLWKLILNGDFGILNQALAAVGIQGPTWLSDPRTALISISIVGVWASLGYPIILFVAALQGVPPELHEAAALDGAGAVRRFFSVTLPAVSPTVFFVSVLTTIGALQMFDLIYVMIGKSSPVIPQTETVIYLFYKTAFIDNNKGLASAIVFGLMVIIMLLTLLQFRLQRRWVHYA